MIQYEIQRNGQIIGYAYLPNKRDEHGKVTDGFARAFVDWVDRWVCQHVDRLEEADYEAVEVPANYGCLQDS